MNLKKMTLNINGADRMFICDPGKDAPIDMQEVIDTSAGRTDPMREQASGYR